MPRLNCSWDLDFNDRPGVYAEQIISQKITVIGEELIYEAVKHWDDDQTLKDYYDYGDFREVDSLAVALEVLEAHRDVVQKELDNLNAVLKAATQCTVFINETSPDQIEENDGDEESPEENEEGQEAKDE